MFLHKMSRYQIVENYMTTAIIHINIYLIILGLIEKELQCPTLDNSKKIRLRLVHIEF